ncbi:MAG: hypothetical protein ACI9R3_006539 [Verrucomicrobiales bacterium]|jgi:hypothetical protein
MKQITIITENRAGEVAEISSLLAGLQVNIEDIEIEKGEELGVITLAVDNYDVALRALRDSGFQAISQDALVVRLEDRPGALAEIAARFNKEAIQLRSMHIIQRKTGHAHVSIVTTDNARAATLLRDVLVG